MRFFLFLTLFCLFNFISQAEAHRDLSSNVRYSYIVANSESIKTENKDSNQNSENIFSEEGVKETVINSEQNIESLNSSGLFTSYIITIIVLLLILFVMIWASNKLKNRANLPKLGFPFGGLVKTNRNIKLVEKYVLEPRKTLYVVNIGKKNFLLGSSETNLNLLSEIEIEENLAGDDGKMKKDNENDSNRESGKKNFSDYLNLPIIIPLILFLSFVFFNQPVFAEDNFLDTIDLRAPVKLKEFGTPIQLIIFMAFLTLLPFFFIMTTSFIRTIIVLGFLRQAIGTQQIPPNQVILGISIFLTIYIMSPVWSEVNQKALTPYLENKISQSVAFDRGVAPIRNFMLKYTKKEELSFFMRIVKLPQPKTAEDVPLHVLIPAYMVSELATAFKIGFFLFLPFLVVDLVVANTLLALGMMMLSPVTISMPFKLLVFTLANGWYLVLQSLVTSFKL